MFLSFFLMLVFMTYNVRTQSIWPKPHLLIHNVQAYLVLAVVLGAGLGHFYLSDKMDVDGVLASGGEDGKGMACH